MTNSASATSPLLFLTGAGGNLGRAVLEVFREAGYRITGTLRPQETATLQNAAENVRLIPLNLLDEGATAAAIEATIRSEGAIDAAILTAGGFSMGDLANTSSADIAAQYRLNFETAYHAARPLFTHMLQRKKGRIFLMGARAGRRGVAAQGPTAYSLSKSLIFQLADLMNQEAGGTAVLTTVVVPSIIDTPANRASMTDADFSKWVTPETIARILLYHCSPEAAALREPVLNIFGDS